MLTFGKQHCFRTGVPNDSPCGICRRSAGGSCSNYVRHRIGASLGKVCLHVAWNRGVLVCRILPPILILHRPIVAIDLAGQADTSSSPNLSLSLSLSLSIYIYMCFLRCPWTDLRPFAENASVSTTPGLCKSKSSPLAGPISVATSGRFLSPDPYLFQLSARNLSPRPEILPKPTNSTIQAMGV